MISVVSAIVGGLIVGVTVPFMAPILYVTSKYSKRIFLVSFALYSIFIGYEYELSNIYHSDPMSLIGIVIPTLLLLDSGLREDMSFKHYHIFLLSLLFSGLIFREVFLFGLTLLLVEHFKDEASNRSTLTVIISISILLLGLYVSQTFLDTLGGSSTQVSFISSIAIFSSLLFWRRVRTSGF